MSSLAPPSIIGHNRLEPRPRSTEFNRSLRAEVRDPTWLLARQWQLKEFRAEDRGTPAFAEVTMALARINQVTSPTQPVRPYEGRKPLEAVVHAQAAPVGPGLRLRMGRHWHQLLRTTGLERYYGLLGQHFPLRAQQEDASYSLAYAQERTTEAHQVLLAAGEQALDGYALYAALLANIPLPTAADAEERVPADTPLFQSLAATAGVDERDLPTLHALSVQFVNCYFRLYFAGQELATWSIPDLSYQYTLGAATTGPLPLALTSTDHPGGELAWYAVDQDDPAAFRNITTGAAGGITQAQDPIIIDVDWPDQFRENHPDVQTQTLRFLPTEVQFPGAPNARWWEFEDRRVDLGQLTGDPSDFGRMLLQEFAFLYQNDWFSLPYEVPLGSRCTVQSLQITDVFGLRYTLSPAGFGEQLETTTYEPIDNDAGRWSLFGNAWAGERTSAQPQLLIPPTAVAPLVGKPVEQVFFRREEATNLVWAVEQLIPDGFTHGVDGAAAAKQVTEYLRSKAAPMDTTDQAAYRYQLANTVAENWVPFVPVPDTEGTYHLEQGAMQRLVEGLVLRPADATVQPRTSLLQLGNPADPYQLYEGQIPPSGVRVEGAFRRTRWLDGRTVLWFSRTRAIGQGNINPGSSSLVFDQLATP